MGRRAGGKAREAQEEHKSNTRATQEEHKRVIRYPLAYTELVPHLRVALAWWLHPSFFILHSPRRGSGWLCSRPARSLLPFVLPTQAGNPRPFSKSVMTSQKWAIDHPVLPGQYRAILSGTQKPILPHPRSAECGRARKKQIPMCSLQPWAFSQVKVMPRQWMVGPRRDSRSRLGETPTGASSAVNYSQRREGEASGP
jgi:hypothetical protein